MKRLFCTIMTIAMVLSTMTAFTGMAFAGTVSSKQLENAITAVKKVVDIPESLNKFEYNYDEKTESETQIALSWSDDEGENSISVSVDTEGNILSYRANMPEFEANGLPKITKTQAEAVAGEHLKKFLSKNVGSFKLQNSTSDSYSRDYSFNYRMYVNDIPCDFITVSIDINKYAGKLSNYIYSGELADLSREYPTADKIISVDDAKKAYISKLGPTLKYLSYYDYEKENLKIYAAYESDDNNKSIDATTGQVVRRYNEIRPYGNMAKREAATEDAGGGNGGQASFTEEELKEIQTTERLIDKNQADTAARSFANIPTSEKLTNASLNKSSDPNRAYAWNLAYEKHYVTLNAKNGSLSNFHSTESIDVDDKRDIGNEKAKAIADGYLDKACSDEKAQLKWTNTEQEASAYSGYNYTYTRQVNDIGFDNNYVNIVVDKATGKIRSYGKMWYDQASFPELKGVITQETAFDKVAELGDFGLMYKKSGEKGQEGNILLVYTLKNGSNYMIDAYKGVRIDYVGNVFKEAKEYSDISGHWAEKTVNELKTNGYYLEGDKFLPKAATTQLEFFKYLYSPQQGWYHSNEEFYEMLVRSKVITKAEINAKAHITRQEAARFTIRYMGLDKLAKNSSIFKNMYTDQVNEAYLGYASAAYGMGLMKGDAKGRFNGSAPMNHAEVACLIYNTLDNTN